MFISTLLGAKRVMKAYAIIALAPPEIKKELDDVTIIYRGIVSLDGVQGDMLLRKKNNKTYNVVWKQDYGEMREIESHDIPSLVKLFDSLMQDMVVRESSKTLAKYYIINQKIEFKSTSFKKAEPVK